MQVIKLSVITVLCDFQKHVFVYASLGSPLRVPIGVMVIVIDMLGNRSTFNEVTAQYEIQFQKLLPLFDPVTYEIQDLFYIACRYRLYIAHKFLGLSTRGSNREHVEAIYEDY